MKGRVGIGEERMEEGEISTITQLRQMNEGKGLKPQRVARLRTAWRWRLSTVEMQPLQRGRHRKPGYRPTRVDTQIADKEIWGRQWDLSFFSTKVDIFALGRGGGEK